MWWVLDGLFKFHLHLNLSENKEWKKKRAHAHTRKEKGKKIQHRTETIQSHQNWSKMRRFKLVFFIHNNLSVFCCLNVHDEFQADDVTCVSYYGEERMAVRGDGRPSKIVPVSMYVSPKCNFIMNHLYVAVWLSCGHWRRPVCAIYIVKRFTMYIVTVTP